MRLLDGKGWRRGHLVPDEARNKPREQLLSPLLLRAVEEGGRHTVPGISRNDVVNSYQEKLFTYSICWVRDPGYRRKNWVRVLVGKGRCSHLSKA